MDFDDVVAAVREIFPDATLLHSLGAGIISVLAPPKMDIYETAGDCLQIDLYLDDDADFCPTSLVAQTIREGLRLVEIAMVMRA